MSPTSKNENPNNETINSIINDTTKALNKNEWMIIGGKKKWIRNCPVCHNNIIVSSEKYYRESTEKNKLCLFCAMKKSHKNRGHISKENKGKIEVKCPQCGIPRFYYRTILNSRVCKSCSAKNKYPTRKKSLLCGIQKRKHGKVIRPRNLKRNCPRCNHIIKHTSLHYINKNKHRICKSCACKDNLVKNNINFPFVPSFNLTACNIIDNYGKQNGYNFQHAMNGGEVCIKPIGVWLDGYDKNKNVVIECYEPFHYYCNGTLKQKDLIREINILNHLKCKFIRIKYTGKTNEIKNINIL